VREILLKHSSVALSSTFDDRPSKLFDGMHHARIALLLAQRGQTEGDAALYVTQYNKWYKDERDIIFETLTYTTVPRHLSLPYFPKVRSRVEWSILDNLYSKKTLLGSLESPGVTDFRVYYKITGVGHWFTITARPPKFFRGGTESSSTRENSIHFKDDRTRDLAFVLLNSTLFYWFYQVRTNCRDFNPSDYRTFPVAASLPDADFSDLAERLQNTLDESIALINVKHSQTGTIKLEQFKPRAAKPIIDEIDRALAQHYGFTAEELDFIINYDIKYRMGRDGGAGG